MEVNSIHIIYVYMTILWSCMDIEVVYIHGYVLTSISELKKQNKNGDDIRNIYELWISWLPL